MTDVLETCDGKSDDWVSEYEFTDNEISNIWKIGGGMIM